MRNGRIWLAAGIAALFFPLIAEVPEDVFSPGDSRFQAAGEGMTSPYELRDAFGSPVRKGRMQNGSIALSGLPCGYYWVSAEGGERSFCILPAFAGNVTQSPFAVDVAVRGGLGDFRGRMREGLLFYRRLLERSGTAAFRERFYWFEIERKPGAFAFSSAERILRPLSGERKISFVVSGPPEFRKDRNGFPSSLVDVYRFARACAEKFRGKSLCWEFWNEQDQGSLFLPAPWKYTALQKAAWLGFKAGDPECLVSAGSFCTYPLGGEMISGTMFAGELAEYCDLFNFHIYTPLSRYPEVISGIRKFLHEEVKCDMPVWITECGTHAEGDASFQGVSADTRSLNKKQEMIWCEFLPKANLTLRQLGVSRIFTFVLRRHIERNGLKEWGMVRKDLSVKPLYAAYAVMNREIGSAELLGEAPVLEDGKCFVFRRKDGTFSLVLWNCSALDRQREEPLPESECDRLYERRISLPGSGKIVAVNVFGTPVPVQRSGKNVYLTATKYPVYVHGFRQIPPGVRQPDPEGEKRAPSDSLDRTIVFDGDLTGKNSMRVSVTNLDTVPKRIRIEHNLLSAAGIPAEVFVEPLASAGFSVTDIRSGSGGIEFRGRVDGKRSTRLFLPAHFFQMRRVPLKGFQEVGRWRKHSSGRMEIVWDENVGGLKVDAVFQKPDRWIYPAFAFRKEEESLLKDAVGISFEIRTEQTEETLSNPSLVWVSVAGDRKYRFPCKPSVGNWVENKVLFPKGKILAVEIGMNPKKERITYWIRNISLLYKP